MAAAIVSYDVAHSVPWDWRVSLYTWTKGIAAGAYLAAVVLTLAGLLEWGSSLWRFAAPLLALGFRPVPLSGPPGMKVVDVGIQRMLEAIAERDADVVLGSHDGDFLPQVQALLGSGRRVALLGFREFVNGGYAELADAGLQVFDLETDARAFNKVLPRVRIIDIDSFDPAAYL